MTTYGKYTNGRNVAAHDTGVIGKTGQVCRCGHSWMSHAYYDDSLERYVAGGCEHWSGCRCKAFRERDGDKGREEGSKESGDNDDFDLWLGGM